MVTYFQEVFQENENDTYLAKPCIVVGKLKIKESDLFERKEEDEKPAVQIGKINASDLFNGASDEKGMSINHFAMLEIILLIREAFIKKKHFIIDIDPPPPPNC